MELNNIYIVLTRPDEARNIGSACRAMANNDICHLRIVGKKEDYDEEKVRTLAIHAVNLWEDAEFFDSISEATKDCIVSAATTRRKGKKRGKLLFPEEFAESMESVSGKIAIVFGNERTGLTDEEVDECTTAITIPSSESFGSLNLSHAVQIMSYQMFRSKKKQTSGLEQIPLERLDKTVSIISEKLEDIGFFKVTGKPDMEIFWRSVLSRAALTESEAQYIEKVFTKAAGLAKKHRDE